MWWSFFYRVRDNRSLSYRVNFIGCSTVRFPWVWVLNIFLSWGGRYNKNPRKLFKDLHIFIIKLFPLIFLHRAWALHLRGKLRERHIVSNFNSLTNFYTESHQQLWIPKNTLRASRVWRPCEKSWSDSSLGKWMPVSTREVRTLPETNSIFEDDGTWNHLLFS